MNKNIDLLKENTYLLSFKFLLSSILGTLSVSFYILFDTIFIGQAAGGDGLAALNICLPIYTLLSCMGLLLGMGGGAAFSLARGKNDMASAHKTFTLSILLGVLMSLCFSAIGILYLEDIAYWLGATPAIIELVTDYMHYLFLFAPSFMLVHILTVFMRNNDLPHIAMISTIISGLVNVVLDIIFMFPLGMGLKGAALATCLSSLLSLGILIFSILKKPGELKWHPSPFDKVLMKQIFSIGLPTFIVEICGGIVIFLFNNVLLIQVGTIGVSAYGIIANIALMAMAVFNGIGQGIQPLISMNHAAGQIPRVLTFKKIGLIVSFIVGILFYVVGLLMRYEIAGLFISNEPELLEVAAHAIPYYFIAFLLVGVNLITNYYYQAIGESRYSVLISLSRGLIFVLIGLMILPGLLGIVGIWLVVPFAELCTLVCLGIFYKLRQHIQVRSNYSIET